MELDPQLAANIIFWWITTDNKEVPELSPFSYCIVFSYYWLLSIAYLILYYAVWNVSSLKLDFFFLKYSSNLAEYSFFNVVADKNPSYPYNKENEDSYPIWTPIWWELTLLLLPL